MSTIRSGEHGHDFEQGKSFQPTACLDAFMDEVGSEITGACMVPLNLPKAEIYNIIKRAIKWFRKNYEYSLKELEKHQKVLV